MRLLIRDPMDNKQPKKPEWLAIDPDGQTKQGIPLWLALLLFFIVIAIFLFGKR